jgi:hypothetical protein
VGVATWSLWVVTRGHKVGCVLRIRKERKGMKQQRLKAHVQTFLGPRTIVVESVWCFDGKVERIFGEGSKYKFDEEPFVLFLEVEE